MPLLSMSIVYPKMNLLMQRLAPEPMKSWHRTAVYLTVRTVSNQIFADSRRNTASSIHTGFPDCRKR